MRKEDVRREYSAKEQSCFRRKSDDVFKVKKKCNYED